MKRVSLIGSFIFILLIGVILPIDTARAMGSIPEGAKVASIGLEGLNRAEATEILTEQVLAWQEQGPIEAESDYETVYIPRELFLFDIEGTLDELEERTKREWSNFFIKPKDVHTPLHVEISPAYRDTLNWSEEIDKEKTLDKALLLAENLREASIEIEYNEDATFELITLAEVERTVSTDLSDSTVNRIAEEVNEIVIASEESFSFLDDVTLPKSMPNSEQEMTLVASLLYELSLQTELEIVERHARDTLPEFTNPGLEAVVDRENGKNLLLYNPNSIAYTIEAEMIENELTLSIATTKLETDVTYTVDNEKEIAPRTIYRYSEELTGDEEIILSTGSPGLQVEVYRTIHPTDLEEKRELLARDFYPPEHGVILIAGPTDEEEVEEEVFPDDSSLHRLLDSASFGERIARIEACEGDPNCESELQISSFEKMMLECFVTDPIAEVPEGGEAIETTEPHPFCDFLYSAFFLYLISSDEFVGEPEEAFTDENELELEFDNDELYEEDFAEEEMFKGVK